MLASRVVRLLLVPAITVALGACQGQAEASPALRTRPPLGPYVQIDETWTAIGGHWTFTGYVDPRGYASDVELDVGEGNTDAMQVEGHVPVSQAVTTAEPVSVTTVVPKVDQVCVRFSVSNEIGVSSSPALCFPYSPPTAHPPSAPIVEIQPDFTVANGAWTFGATVDPQFSPADVVLEIGHGPASKPVYTATIQVEKGVTNTATIQFTTRKVPHVATVCVRFVATNSVATTASKPLCFPRDASS